MGEQLEDSKIVEQISQEFVNYKVNKKKGIFELQAMQEKILSSSNLIVEADWVAYFDKLMQVVKFYHTIQPMIFNPDRETLELIESLSGSVEKQQISKIAADLIWFHLNLCKISPSLNLGYKQFAERSLQTLRECCRRLEIRRPKWLVEDTIKMMMHHIHFTFYCHPVIADVRNTVCHALFYLKHKLVCGTCEASSWLDFALDILAPCDSIQAYEHTHYLLRAAKVVLETQKHCVPEPSLDTKDFGQRIELGYVYHKCILLRDQKLNLVAPKNRAGVLKRQNKLDWVNFDLDIEDEEDLYLDNAISSKYMAREVYKEVEKAMKKFNSKYVVVNCSPKFKTQLEYVSKVFKDLKKN